MNLPTWLAPNRIAVYLGALVTILTGIAALLSSIGTPEAVALGAAVLGFVGLIDRFLRGWQRWEAEVVAPVARAQLGATLPGGELVVSAHTSPLPPARHDPAHIDPADHRPRDRADRLFPEGVPDDDALGVADDDEHEGWPADALDETVEAAEQVHLPDAGMPTSGERGLTP